MHDLPQELRGRLLGQQSLLTEWEAAGERVSDQLLWRWVRAKGSVRAAESCISQHALWRIQLGTIAEVCPYMSTATLTRGSVVYIRCARDNRHCNMYFVRDLGPVTCVQNRCQIALQSHGF